MTAKNTPEVVRLVDLVGNTVSVSADKADARIAGGYTKAGARKASTSTDSK